MSFEQIITPQNIENITFQYTLTNGLRKSTVPNIYVTYNVDQIANIGLAEVKTYIGYIVKKAEISGKSLMATQDNDLTTIISYGVPPVPPNPTELQIKLDGENIGNENPYFVTGLYNCNLTPDLPLPISLRTPFAITLNLPVINIDGLMNVEKDYDFPKVGDNPLEPSIYVYNIEAGYYQLLMLFSTQIEIYEITTRPSMYVVNSNTTDEFTAGLIEPVEKTTSVLLTADSSTNSSFRMKYDLEGSRNLLVTKASGDTTTITTNRFVREYSNVPYMLRATTIILPTEFQKVIALNVLTDIIQINEF